MQLENFAHRDRIRLITTLGLRYETTADQLRHVIVALRGLLVAHPKVLPEPLRVRFVGFGAYSLDLEVFCYVDTADFNEFLAVREDLFLRMMDVVAESGTGFAFPSSTTYLARDGGIDGERGEKASAQVEAWRKAGSLAMPDFSPEEARKLDDSLDWPPKGSAIGAKS
jgi:MscS family membrane protein